MITSIWALFPCHNRDHFFTGIGSARRILGGSRVLSCGPPYDARKFETNLFALQATIAMCSHGVMQQAHNLAIYLDYGSIVSLETMTIADHT